jgi:hypothetical protein
LLKLIINHDLLSRRVAGVRAQLAHNPFGSPIMSCPPSFSVFEVETIDNWVLNLDLRSG